MQADKISGRILLTSTGLSCKTVVDSLESIFTEKAKDPVAIITTAAEDKELNKYSVLAKEQFKDLGFRNIDFVDLELEDGKDLSQYGIIYVCGGNTFKLLKFAKKANLGSSIRELLNRGGTYIGVSAGSIILGPSIEIAGEVNPDQNEVALEDLAGFGITDLIVLPHYSSELEQDVDRFEKRYSVKVERITNSQAILVENGKQTLLS